MISKTIPTVNLSFWYFFMRYFIKIVKENVISLLQYTHNNKKERF
jgi:hypothetical protein